MNATIPRMSRPRGELTAEQRSVLSDLREASDVAYAAYKEEVVEALHAGASFAEVSKFTSLSTNTLQRWKREAE